MTSENERILKMAVQPVQAGNESTGAIAAGAVSRRAESVVVERELHGH
ncbi:MAG: hypothetical protein JSU90_12865 [Nitrospiraceae bacterium]|nr:MAG: hypothetical protein JSU90_12865 [Nitrospiraceae bacterium]